LATVNEIREALGANLAAITDTQVSPYLLNNSTPPTLMILPGPPGGGDFTEYHQAMGNGLESMTWTVRAEVAVNLDIGSQKKLDAFLDVSGPSSVMRAVESDKTLGGLVSDLIVTRSVAGLVPTRDGVAEKIAAEWQVTVYT
jgi:hypothetical protein